MFYTYILFSETLSRFYIGSTSNFEVRMDFHKKAASRKFTGKAKDWIVFLLFYSSLPYQLPSIINFNLI
ncbi:GIY-YIG nuclease family protein [Gramella sp. AN32]|uniref:GIY-YIG nuclease family protein n=1 Tax=Christiangramia antarctica TaxID=2058158 RepID=A0ABW5WYQ7_9FLAO|nr:GIY-YIG nuclease family protein [Gramella sp. AN32]MCM4155105.1 hypothetical protein [Gramella sp. AN32]